MNYELISKMTFAELRALEYDINRVKGERRGMTFPSPERQEEQRANHLSSNAEYDQENQEEWEAKLRKKEFEKTYQQRVDAFDITTISQLPTMVGNLVLGFVGIEKTHEQNHRLIKFDRYYNKISHDVMELARKKAFAIHQAVCVANFEKMKMTKIKEFFALNKSLYSEKIYFKFNSKDNFIQSLNKFWDRYPNSDVFKYETLLTLLIASTR